MTEKAKKFGWEVARELEEKKKTVWERMMPDRKHVMAAVYAIGIFFVVFLIGCWLAGNPFEVTKRLPSAYVQAQGWMGTNEWGIIWSVVLIAMFFEFMDASAGMGFGTALTPLLLVIGFDPKQIVPIVMIQQGTAGLVGAFLHREFENVEWKFKPMSETVKLWMIIAITGVLSVAFSIVAVYGILHMAKIWIKLYVAMLLLVMGAVSLLQGMKQKPYKPWKMLGFAALAGFNKGIGGGGYGPVVTVGGLISGVPVKSMLAVTAISEGTVSTFAVVVWFALLSQGVTIDFLLLPSVMLATMFSAVAAPYMTRVAPEKLWRYVVPIYCCILAAYSFYKIFPDVAKKLGWM